MLHSEKIYIYLIKINLKLLIATSLNDCEHSWDYLNRTITQNKVKILPVALYGKAMEVNKGSMWSRVPVWREKIGRFAGADIIQHRLPSTPFAKLTASARTELGFSMLSFKECYRTVV